MFMMIRCRQVLVVLFALTAGFAVHGFSAEVYVVPKENNAYLLNPRKGWATFTESSPIGKVPVWDDPVFISKIGQFVAALTKR
jgi:hypothetical protein